MAVEHDIHNIFITIIHSFFLPPKYLISNQLNLDSKSLHSKVLPLISLNETHTCTQIREPGPHHGSWH